MMKHSNQGQDLVYSVYVTFYLFSLQISNFYRYDLSATSRAVGHLSKSTEVMKIVNDLMKAPALAATMQEFSKEMTKVVYYF
jgi:hypothetical protein